MIGDVMINCGGGPSRVCAARGRIASLCGPPSGSPSVTSSRDGACLSTAPRKPVLAVRYASALDLSRVSAVASAPRGPCTGCAQRSALIRGRLLTAPSVSHYKGKHQHPQHVSPTTALEVSNRRHMPRPQRARLLLRGRLSTAPTVSGHKDNHQRRQRVSPTTALERRRGRASPSCTGLAARACPRLLSGWAREA